MTRRSWLGALAVALLALGAADARAMTLGDTNLVGLLREAEAIVVGQVQGVTDGVDAAGIPYTEITLDVADSIRGGLSGTYTFRQFGLLEPRLTADGTKKMMPAPSGFPRYAEGEDVVLFLYKQAEWTGLRTTVGLAHGKFTLGPGRVENTVANQGLFENVSMLDGLATENDQRMLATEFGAVNPDTFLSFVRRAVENSWVEGGRMWNTDEGRPGGPMRVPDRVSTRNRTGRSTQRFDRKAEGAQP